MNRGTSALVSATVAAALATLVAPAHAQAPAAPAPAKPAAPAPAKPAPAAPAAKPAAPPVAPAAAKPPAAPAAPKPAAAAPVAATPAAAAHAAPAAAAVPAAPPPAAPAHPAAPPTAVAAPASEAPAPAPMPVAPSNAPPGTTVVLLANAPAPHAPPPPAAPVCPPVRQLEPLFAPAAFLVRFSAGPGYTWASGDPNTKLNGASGGFDLAMGGFVLQNFALHADFGWMEVFDPDFTVDGNVLDSTSVLFQASTFRGGASYYLMPVRAYLSLGVGFAVAALTSYSYSDTSDRNVTLVGREYTKIGPSFAAEVGKEFEVSPFWGLGAAVHYELLSVPAGDDHSKVTVDFAQQISLRFIATFGDR